MPTPSCQMQITALPESNRLRHIRRDPQNWPQPLPQARLVVPSRGNLELYEARVEWTWQRQGQAELSGQRVRARWGRATHARGSMRGASKVENRQSVFGRVQACRVCLRAGRCSGQGRGPDMTLVWPSFFGSWRWLESRGDFPGIAQLASILSSLGRSDLEERALRALHAPILQPSESRPDCTGRPADSADEVRPCFSHAGKEVPVHALGVQLDMFVFASEEFAGFIVTSRCLGNDQGSHT